MTRVPYPGDIDKDVRPKSRARGLGYRFEITRGAVILVLVSVVTISCIRTVRAAGAEAGLREAAFAFMGNLFSTSLVAVVLTLIAWLFMDPYKLYDKIASIFDRKKG